MVKTADVVVGYLVRSGALRIYGAPGEGSCLDIMDAARAKNIDFVATHTSSAAAIMAATDGDLSGRPGVCVTALGAGAANAVAGVARAYNDRVPLIVLAGSPPRMHRRFWARRNLDQNKLFEGVTKDRATLTQARAGRLIAWAWEEAMAPPAGPVHLELPADAAGAAARERMILPTSRRNPDPSPSAIRNMGKLLARAGRAVIVAGSGTRDPGVASALREVVEHLGTPVLTTRRAKGVIPEDHPLAAGMFAAGRLEDELINRANCLLAVGLEPCEIPPRSSRLGPAVLSMAEYTVSPLPLPVASEVTGDLATGLALLRECLPPAGEWNYADWARRGEQFKTRSRSLLTQAWQTRGTHGLAPHRVVEIAREVFPRTTIVSVDSGAHALPVATFWEAYAPKEYLCSGEFGGAGYALPAGIAASIRQTSSPVVAFMGESGFLMNLAEVATASRLGCPLVVVLFVDESLSLVRVAQEQRRYAPLGVSLGALDMPKIAEGLGALGTCVGDEEGLRSALQDAVGTTKPAIVAARVNPHGYRKMYDLLRGKTP